ncbi:MAG: sigma-70 family RNA polymerase sigma factor [Halomonas sp.]
MPSPLSPASHDQAETLYRSEYGWLRGWLRQKLGCPARADDCTQDTFLRVLDSPRTEPVERPRAFLARIATRLLIDDARRARLEQAWRETYALVVAEHARAPSAEEINELVDTLEQVARLLEGLPEKPRQAFLRFRLDGASQAEIASELGVSVSMVKKYVAQGLLHCHRALQDGGD